MLPGNSTVPIDLLLECPEGDLFGPNRKSPNLRISVFGRPGIPILLKIKRPKVALRLDIGGRITTFLSPNCGGPGLGA